MDKDALVSFLEEFRRIVVTDGGDFEILEVNDDYLKLKIKGKKNKKRSRENLFALIKYMLQKKFPGEKIKMEFEHWEVPDEDTLLNKIKKFFKFSSDK